MAGVTKDGALDRGGGRDRKIIWSAWSVWSPGKPGGSGGFGHSGHNLHFAKFSVLSSASLDGFSVLFCFLLSSFPDSKGRGKKNWEKAAIFLVCRP